MVVVFTVSEKDTATLIIKTNHECIDEKDRYIECNHIALFEEMMYLSIKYNNRKEPYSILFDVE